MPNCTAFGCNNLLKLKKNPNLSFQEQVIHGCKILRGKNPFQRTLKELLYQLQAF